MRKQNNGLTNTKSIALSGVISALCFVVMYLAAATDILDLSGMVLCSMIIIIAVIEIGKYYPWLIWLVAGILCMVLLPKKDVALEFVMFGGVYPMIKALFEKLPTPIAWALKIVFFNLVFTGWFLLTKFVFGLDAGLELGVVAYLAANAFFVLSDVAFSLMANLYVTKLRAKLGIGKRKH